MFWQPSHHTDEIATSSPKTSPSQGHRHVEFQDRMFKNGLGELIPSLRHHRIGTLRNLLESLPGFSRTDGVSYI